MAGHIATAKNTNWTTSEREVALIKQVFGGHIDLDPCSNEQSIVGARRSYTLPETNGLKEAWDAESVFFNPPFGRSYLHPSCNSLCSVERLEDLEGKKTTLYVCTLCGQSLTRKDVEGSSIADWVRKAHASSRRPDVFGIIGILPAAISTQHFHRYVWPHASAIVFPEGRLSFGGLPIEDEADSTAPMDTVLVLWGDLLADAFERAFSTIGYVDRLDLQRLARQERTAA
jgi:hypothetical protein